MTLQEEIEAYVRENPVVNRIELFSGKGFSVHIVPDGYFESSPVPYQGDGHLTGAAVCDDNDPDNYWVCTRTRYHPGPHVAGYGDNTVLRVW